jgi:hypothetical protein
MSKRINKRGFATVELIIVLIVIIVVGFAAWTVGKHSNKARTAKSSNSQIQSQTPIGSIKGWKTFVDRRDRIYFQYPSDWKVDIHKTAYQANDVKGDMLNGTIKSPTDKVEIVYSNFVAGVGDPGCDPPGQPPTDQQPPLLKCPTINIIGVEDLPGFESTHMKYIEKISHWKSDVDFYIPSFGLAVDTADFPLKVGTLTGQSDTFIRTNFTDDAGIFAHNWTIDRNPQDGFSTYQEAKDYLASSEVKTAKKIILSTHKY